jgi:predicted acyltransferase
MATEVLTAHDPATVSGKGRRLLSIDLLRGLTITFMIMVNDNANDSAYWAMKHADWNGFSPTDLVFPTFLFLIGVSTVFSMASRLAAGADRGKLFLHVLRRSIIIFLLGMVVNNFPYFHLATARFYGVLPRIAICYLVVGAFYIFFPGWKSKVGALVGCLVGYWILMRFVPVPGYGMPGTDVPFLDKDGNLVAWLDRQIFAANHLYEKTRDPEGLLSTLPSFGTMLLGILTGLWLKTQRTLGEKVRGLAIAGVSCVLLGGLWNFAFPVNKKLWTSSFVLYAGGWSLLLLTFFVWITDLRSESKEKLADKQSIGKPTGTSFWATLLLVFGTNAIAAYELSEVGGVAVGLIHFGNNLNPTAWLYLKIHSVVSDLALASFLYSFSYMAACWIIIYLVLYRNRIFIKI